MDIRTSHAAVRDIADDGDFQIVEPAFSLSNDVSIKQSLGRMFVRSVAAIDNRSAGQPGQGVWRA